MSARETIFTNIRKALTDLPEPAAYPEYDLAIAEPHWLTNEKDDLALFQRRLTATGGLFFASALACAEWLKNDGTKLLYLPSHLEELATIFRSVLPVTHEYDRSRVDEIDAALTPAAGAIAESGSVILTDASTPDRLTALAPWRHIALVRRADLHRTISSAISQFPTDSNIIFVTGPSKTADVEGILIQGVHGPGQQACLII